MCHPSAARLVYSQQLSEELEEQQQSGLVSHSSSRSVFATADGPSRQGPPLHTLSSKRASLDLSGHRWATLVVQARPDSYGQVVIPWAHRGPVQPHDWQMCAGLHAPQQGACML